MNKANTVNNNNLLPSISPAVDQVGVIERAARITKRSIKKNAKIAGLKMVLSMIDLTTLEGMDTPGKVKQMCRFESQMQFPKPMSVKELTDAPVKKHIFGMEHRSISMIFPMLRSFTTKLSIRLFIYMGRLSGLWLIKYQVGLVAGSGSP